MVVNRKCPIISPVYTRILWAMSTAHSIVNSTTCRKNFKKLTRTQTEIFRFNPVFCIVVHREKSTTFLLVEGSTNQHATFQKPKLSKPGLLLTLKCQVKRFLEQNFARHPFLQSDLSYFQFQFGVQLPFNSE